MTKRSYTSEFKVKVVLEVLKGELLLGEIAGGYGINPNLVTRWKREFLENAASVFEKSEESKQKQRESKDAEAEKLQMLKMIGQLTLERDYLQAARGKATDRRLL